MGSEMCIRDRPHTLKQLIISVFVQVETSLVPMETVFLAPTDVKNVLQPPTVPLALPHCFSKDQYVKCPAMMDLLQSDLLVLDVQKDVLDALKTESATTVKMVSSCTKETATVYVQLEPLVTDPLETGSVLPAMNPAKLASIILLTAPVASTDSDTFRPHTTVKAVS